MLGQTKIEEELSEAARSVATVLDLTPVGIEDTVDTVSSRARRFGNKHLIAPDAEAPIRKKADVVCIQARGTFQRKHDDEVVSRSVHFPKLHARSSEVQYTDGSPSGRVLKRRCTHRY